MSMVVLFMAAMAGKAQTGRISGMVEDGSQKPPEDIYGKSDQFNFRNTEAEFRNARDTRVGNLSFIYRYGKPIKAMPQRKTGGSKDEPNRVRMGEHYGIVAAVSFHFSGKQSVIFRPRGCPGLFFSLSLFMPSFDIVSKVDAQLLDNAVNVTRKEIMNRFDFKDSHVVIDLNKKDYKLNIEALDDMKIRQLIDVLINRSNKQGISPEAFDLSKEPYPSGKVVKTEVSVRNGLKQEDAKKLVKLIKDSGLKVQAQIMDDLVRVTAKKIDDLQEVIQLCKTAELGLPLQYENMRS